LETLLTQPILLIAGSEAGTRWNSENAFKRVKGTKELVIVDGANHFDLYDKPYYVDQAEEKLAEFFEKHLQNIHQYEGELIAKQAKSNNKKNIRTCTTNVLTVK
jgi:predicted dienelactone hydrolase